MHVLTSGSRDTPEITASRPFELRDEHEAEPGLSGDPGGATPRRTIT